MRLLSRAAALFLAALMFLLCLSSCRVDLIDPADTETDDDLLSPALPSDDGSNVAGELYGSYLTLYIGKTPLDILGLPYIRIFHSYNEVEDYYDSTIEDFLYGKRFTMAMASFTDDYFSDHDVMIAAINEPSSYVNHTAEPIEITDADVRLKVARHIPESCPKADTQYHLIFTAPKGSFDGIDQKKLSLDISEVVDPENNAAFDAERFRIYYPEFYPFCYRTDALIDDPQVILDTIGSYDELQYFYKNYADKFDLDYDFKRNIGTLYNWEVFERYFIVATIIPCTDETEPVTSEVFVNNLEIYITIDAHKASDGERPKACYLLLTAIEKSDLEGVNLSSVNLSV